MEKKFTKFELARLKRTAQNVDQFIQKKNKLEAKKQEIDAELAEVLNLIELTDAPTKAMTGGYGTEDIIKKVVTATDKLDKNGNVIKQTSYEFIYPDTIIPPVEETVGQSATEEAVSEVEEEEVTEVANNTIY
jgi:hypothetical protein